MHNRSRTALSVAAAITAAGLTLAAARAGQAPGRAQSPSPGYHAPRAHDGHADLNGIWQAVNTANWDIQDHPARQGPVDALGAAFSIPAGAGVVDGNDIPYQPWASEKKKQNADNWLTLDPEIKCYMPGVPRATYMPHPFQIVQARNTILMAYEFAGASRIVRMTKTEDAPIDSWMGWSRGRWEGETLVVDVSGFNDQTWFDRAGNFHSEALHVVERYTMIDNDHIVYEATIEDQNVFTRPWKISMPLYRRIEKNVQLLQFRCGEYVEEFFYGELVSPPRD